MKKKSFVGEVFVINASMDKDYPLYISLLGSDIVLTSLLSNAIKFYSPFEACKFVTKYMNNLNVIIQKV